MTAKQLEDVFDGCALLEYCGRLYETMGDRDEHGRYGFADMNDGHPLYLKWETLLSNSCDVQY